MTRVSRVLLLNGEIAAWMIDVVSADLISAGKVKEDLSSRQIVLDLVRNKGIPVASGQVEVSSALLDPGQSA